MTANSETEIYLSVLDVVVDAGFSPFDDLHDGSTMSNRDAQVLAYFAERGWEAWRPEEDGWSLVRWGDEGIELLLVDRNGVTGGEVTFPASERGIIWFSRVVEV